MKTCDTCLHWLAKNDTLIKRDRMKAYDGVMVCDKLSAGSGTPPPDGISVDGYIEALDYAVLTGPKFGCIHHLPKAL